MDEKGYTVISHSVILGKSRGEFLTQTELDAPGTNIGALIEAGHIVKGRVKGLEPSHRAGFAFGQTHDEIVASKEAEAFAAANPDAATKNAAPAASEGTSEASEDADEADAADEANEASEGASEASETPAVTEAMVASAEAPADASAGSEVDL